MRDTIDLNALFGASSYENQDRGGLGGDAVYSKAARARKAQRDAKWRVALAARRDWSEAEIAAENARLELEIAQMLAERSAA